MLTEEHDNIIILQTVSYFDSEFSVILNYVLVICICNLLDSGLVKIQCIIKSLFLCCRYL